MTQKEWLQLARKAKNKGKYFQLHWSICNYPYFPEYDNFKNAEGFIKFFRQGAVDSWYERNFVDSFNK